MFEQIGGKVQKGLKGKQYSYYPMIEDDDFEERIYRKKEYHMHKQIDKSKYSYDELCAKPVKSAVLLEQQELLKNFMSPDTPYKSLLIFHGVGVGKTCAAIQIAEGFKESILKNNGNIYILAGNDAQYNFMSELINPICMDYVYASEDEIALLHWYESNPSAIVNEKKKKLERDIYQRIRNIKKGGVYKFMGYATFQNRVIGRVVRDSKTGKELLDDKGNKKRKLQYPQIKNLDNSLLIIDEAHTIENNDYGESIMHIKKVSKNLRIVMLTATPMYHSAKEIVSMLNFLLPEEKKLEAKKIFETDNEISAVLGRKLYKLTPNGLDIIQQSSKGIVSFLRSVNPYTYANYESIGIVPDPIDVPKDVGLLYTHLVRCEMSELQYVTYEAQYRGKLPNHMKHMLNMIFPDPNSSYGIYRTDELYKLRLRAPKKWLEKNGIEFYDSPEKKIEIKGDILKYKNLAKYSPKFKKLLDNLKDIGKGGAFVYIEDIEGIGIRLLTNLLLENGYNQYLGDSKQKVENTFIVLSGIIDSSERLRLLKLYNQPANKYGEIIKIILGSGVAKESITMHNIRQIHIINYQYDFSSLEQILGRGLRHCTHRSLDDKDRTLRVYKYVSSMPNVVDQYKMSLMLPRNYSLKGWLGWVATNFMGSDKYEKSNINKILKNPAKYYLQSAEEREYNIQEYEHFVIKKIERRMKQTAFDCALNKKGNVFPQEVKEYKNCGVNKDKKCSVLCDYVDCDIKCTYEPDVVDLELEDLDTDTYSKTFAKKEINEIIDSIKKYFSKESLADIVELRRWVEDNVTLSYLEIKYIYEAIQEMLDEHIIFKDRFDRDCYLIYRGKYYIIQPLDMPEDTPMAYRMMPIMESKKSKISLDEFLEKNLNKSKLDYDDVETYFSRLKKIKGIQALLAIGHMPLELTEKMIRYIISKKRKVGFNDVDKLLLRFFERGAIYEDNELIGYTVNGQGHCYIDGNWIDCPGQKPSKNDEQVIVGLIEEDSNGKTIFKTRPPFSGDKSSKDKRTIKTGTVCKTSSKNTLLEITKKLDIKHDKKITVTRLCRKIERHLRAKQLEADKHKTGERWMYDTYETQ